MNRLPYSVGLAFCLLLGLEGTAVAFCRATTCEPTFDQECPVDEAGCPIPAPEGIGRWLYWPSLCATYAIQQDGSPLRGVSFDEASVTLDAAFRTWISAGCNESGTPSLGAVPLGSAACDRAEFNPPLRAQAGAPNANLLIFRDDSWPYGDRAVDVARTTLTFDTNTGAIFDADIEINSFANELSVPGDHTSQDLQSILTHEVGHLFGLAHTEAPRATMNAQYALDDIAYRSLSEDDVQGICEMYPPLTRDSSLEPDPISGGIVCPASTSPAHGFSAECQSDSDFRLVAANASCLSLAASSPSSESPSSPVTWLGLMALIALRRRRPSQASVDRGK